jgi:hypothetical protein
MFAALDIRATIDELTKEEKQIVPVGQPTYGFLNRASRSYGIKENWYGDVQVNPKAKILLVSQFDNCDHHEQKDREIVVSHINGRSIMVGPLRNGKEWPDELVTALLYDGPIRLGVSNGEPHAVPVAYDDNIRLALHSILKRCKRDPDFESRKVAQKWGRVKWKQMGNRLRPQLCALITNWLELEGTTTNPERYNAVRATLLEGMEVPGKSLKTLLTESYGQQPEFELINDKATYEVRISEYDNTEGTTMIEHGKLEIANEFTEITYNAIGFGITPSFTNDTMPTGAPNKSRNESVITIDDLKQQGIPGFNDYAGKVKTEKKELTEETLQHIRSLEVVNDAQVREFDAFVLASTDIEPTNSELLAGEGDRVYTQVLKPFREINRPTTMNYWDDETAMIDGFIPLPNREIALAHNLQFTGIKEIATGKFTEYPSHSQPGYVERMNAGVSAVSELFGTRLDLRKVLHNPRDDAQTFASTYFTKMSTKELPQVNINSEAIIKWLQERPDSVKIGKDLVELLSEGIDVHGMDKVKVHLKKESRMKDQLIDLLSPQATDNEMPGTIEEQRIRLIVWQRKGITLIVAAFFLELKENFKRCLRNDVLYADGLTPQQLSAWLNKITVDECTFVEDDLKKQDRQTDMTLIETEMEIYKILGGNPAVVDFWKVVHMRWRARGMQIKFKGDASRLTGQATTALGNVIINLLVHMRLVKELGNQLNCMVALGDDNALMAKVNVTPDQVSKNSARHFNMKSDPHISKDCGTFLRQIIYKNRNGCLESGPDVIRLRRRYEVLNGSGRTSKENVEMRKMSYLCMLGNVGHATDIVKRHDYPIKLEQWYDWELLRHATAIKYRTTEEGVENELSLLLNMIDKNELIVDYKMMFTEAERVKD